MPIDNMSNSQYAYELLKKGLDATSLRSKVIANNIANINTKGYKSYYVSFEDTLKGATDGLSMKTDNGKHISDTSDLGQISVEQDTSTSMKADGNNVDVDNEMANMAANQLLYNALVSQANSKISLENYIINGGR